MAKIPDTLGSLAEQIASIAADYQGSGEGMDSARVALWIAQFPKEYRVGILTEMKHVLERTYISEKEMGHFLDRLATNEKLTGGDPKQFWAKTHLLTIQQRGASQRDMVKLFSSKLAARSLQALKEPSAATASFVYLDDVIFTGNHLFRDISAWIPAAPQSCTVNVITAFIHTGGIYRAFKNRKENLNTLVKAAGKEIRFVIWRIAEIEDRRSFINVSDVLRPKAAPADESVAQFIKSLEAELETVRKQYGVEAQLAWRTGNHVGERGYFSGAEGRALLEDQMLIAGCKVREICTHLKQSSRPLGYQFLTTLGFGGLVVTYRNCPNNCPVAWWAGDPWYPLFPRRTNTQTAVAHLFD